MNVTETILTRKSIRAFKPDPIPQKVLKEVLETALRAPSWANTQPSPLLVLTGYDCLGFYRLRVLAIPASTGSYWLFTIQKLYSPRISDPFA